MRIKDFVKQSGGTVSDLFNLPLSVLDPNPDNIRFDTEAVRAQIRSIADSIKESGFLRSRALTVRLTEDRAIIVDGNLRLLACRLAVAEGAELLTVPCVPEAAGTSAADRLANMLVANSGLAHSALEKVTAIKLLLSYGWTDTKVGQRLGISRATINNLLDLAGADPAVQQMVAGGTISATQALAVVRSEGDGAAAVIAKVAEKVREGGGKRVTARAFKEPAVPTPPARPTKPPVGLVGAAREVLRIWDAGSLDKDFDEAMDCLRAVLGEVVS